MIIPGETTAPIPHLQQPTRRTSGTRFRRSLWGELWRWFVTALWFSVLAVVITSTAVVLAIYQQARADGARPAQAIVVLGTAQYNGWPGPVFQARLDHALQLWQAGYAPLLVVTGGKAPGDGYTEGEAGWAYLTNAGVPPESIVVESEALNTWESMQQVSALLRPMGISEVILVSDGFHLFRARMMAHDVGLHATGSAALESPIRTGGSGEFSYVLREAGGILAHLWTTRLDPDGRFLALEAS